MVLIMYRAVNAAVALSLGLLIVCGGFSPITRFLTAIVAAKFAINAVFGIDEQWFRQPSPGWAGCSRVPELIWADPATGCTVETFGMHRFACDFPVQRTKDRLYRAALAWKSPSLVAQFRLKVAGTIYKWGAAMFKDQREVAIVLLGFRLGQQSEIYTEATIYASPFALLIPDIQAKLLLALEQCQFKPRVASALLAMIGEQTAWLENADSVMAHKGLRAMIDELFKSCRRLESSILQSLGNDGRFPTCFQIGKLLGRSSYVAPLSDKGRKQEGNSSWMFHELPQLEQALGSLGLNLGEISGLPQDLSASTTSLLANDERFDRYPRHRWGVGLY